MKYIILTFLFTNIMWSQNLDAHQWEERIIVISVDKSNSKLAETQFNLLQIEKEKLIDRKLVIYKCIDGTCEFYDFKQESKTFKIDRKIEGFEVVLMGLDGGKKYESNKVEKIDVFFNLIDRMPMRRQELQNKKKNE